MAYTIGTSGDRNIVNQNGNRYFGDRNTSIQQSNKNRNEASSYHIKNSSSPSPSYGVSSNNGGVGSS